MARGPSSSWISTTQHQRHGPTVPRFPNPFFWSWPLARDPGFVRFFCSRIPTSKREPDHWPGWELSWPVLPRLFYGWLDVIVYFGDFKLELHLNILSKKKAWSWTFQNELHLIHISCHLYVKVVNGFYTFFDTWQIWQKHLLQKKHKTKQRVGTSHFLGVFFFGGGGFTNVFPTSSKRHLKRRTFQTIRFPRETWTFCLRSLIWVDPFVHLYIHHSHRCHSLGDFDFFLGGGRRKI